MENVSKEFIELQSTAQTINTLKGQCLHERTVGFLCVIMRLKQIIIAELPISWIKTQIA